MLYRMQGETEQADAGTDSLHRENAIVRLPRRSRLQRRGCCENMRNRIERKDYAMSYSKNFDPKKAIEDIRISPEKITAETIQLFLGEVEYLNITAAAAEKAYFDDVSKREAALEDKRAATIARHEEIKMENKKLITRMESAITGGDDTEQKAIERQLNTLGDEDKHIKDSLANLDKITIKGDRELYEAAIKCCDELSRAEYDAVGNLREVSKIANIWSERFKKTADEVYEKSSRLKRSTSRDRLSNHFHADIIRQSAEDRKQDIQDQRDLPMRRSYKFDPEKRGGYFD